MRRTRLGIALAWTCGSAVISGCDGAGDLDDYARSLEKRYDVRMYRPRGFVDEQLLADCLGGDARDCVRQGLHIDGFIAEYSECGIPLDAANRFYERACDLGLQPACRMLSLGAAARIRGIDVPLRFLRDE